MNPKNNTGIKIIGFGAILDENELLNGWIKTLRFFCDEVWALYDPTSTDGSIDTLKRFEKEFQNSEVPLKLYKQNITLGDSNRYNQGSKITFLANINEFLKKHVPLNCWTMWLAGDERLDISRSDDLYKALQYAEEHGFNAVKFKLYDIYNTIDQYINYDYLNITLAHRKLIKRTTDYQYNLTLHSGYRGGRPWYNTDLPFYHFGNYYNQQRNWWRRENGINYLSRIPKDKQFIQFDSPFLKKNWKTEA